MRYNSVIFGCYFLSTSLTQSIVREHTKNAQLSSQLTEANNLIKASTQPYTYVVETIKQVCVKLLRFSALISLNQRDATILSQQSQIEMLQRDLKVLQDNNAELKRVHAIMTADLEHLLSQRADIDEVFDNSTNARDQFQFTYLLT